MQASYVVLKFDDEETEEQIEFEDMDNEEEFIEEENANTCILAKVGEWRSEEANQEVEDGNEEYWPGELKYINHEKIEKVNELFGGDRKYEGYTNYDYENENYNLEIENWRKSKWKRRKNRKLVLRGSVRNQH